MKDFIKTTSRLFIICVVAGLLLAATHAFTDPVIKRQQAQGEIGAYSSIFPDAQTFEEVAFNDFIFDAANKIVRLMNDAGEDIGYAVSVDTKGYKGTINLMVGFRPDGTLAGVRINTHTETEGLGSLIAEPDFYNQFEDKKTPLSIDRDIAAITGATVSSRGVLTGVNYAAEVYESILP